MSSVSFVITVYNKEDHVGDTLRSVLDQVGDFGSEIVVVGKLTDRAIDRDEIELTQANDLGDLFRRAPSVSVGAAIGIAAKIYVRGIEDAQLNISIKSARDRAFFARSFDVGDTPSAQTA